MKLKSYDAVNLPNARTTAPKIGINCKSGAIRFNQIACDQIGLQPGQLVKFHNDEAEPMDWYLEIVKKDGFVIREKSKSALAEGGLIIQSTSLTRLIFDSVAFEGNSGSITVGKESVDFEKRKLWPLITAALKN
jgi:hypothetical protein